MARKYEQSKDWPSMQEALRFISLTAEKEIERIIPASKRLR